MTKLGLEKNVINYENLEASIERFAENGIQLPTFKELSDPECISDKVKEELKNMDPNIMHPLNLYRINWYNDENNKNFRKTPYYFILPKEITGVDAKIVVMAGAFFPIVQCHKVLAAYGCLAPRVVTGQFNPLKHKAIWPSTGNYCRGGIAVSRIMNCRGVAILPEEMSEERFSWLKKWVLDPENDIHRTYGCESNVKEIYDKCNELDKEEDNVIFNQFCEFGNALIHYLCTGKAIEKIFHDVVKESNNSNLKLKGYVSATGSAGTLSAGDYLKDNNYKDCKIVAVEASECPTLLCNGFGAHNIQGIGDKHIPYIHNVINTDFATGVSDSSTDSLYILFNTEEGKKFLKEQKKVSNDTIQKLSLMGLSSICNTIAAIKLAKYNNMTENDVIITVATDPAFMYKTEEKKIKEKYFKDGYSELTMAEIYGQHIKGITTDNLLELTKIDRDRIFNLGYYTWVEQQNVDIKDFIARKDTKFWSELRKFIPIWDNMIIEFNEKVRNHKLFKK